jgi:hypothetical protein
MEMATEKAFARAIGRADSDLGERDWFVVWP